MPMTTLFDQLRQVSAAQVAEDAGLHLKRRGSRSWTCCPLHGEKTPSLCFYEDGGWHCFGCNQGGDAVALYAALYRLDMGAAARALAEAHGITPGERTSPPPVNVSEARRELNRFEAARWTRYCDITHAAQAVLEQLGDPDTAWDNPEFVRALRAKTAAEMELEQMRLMNLQDWIELYRREVKLHAHDGGGSGVA